MNISELIDHTNLNNEASEADLDSLLEEALANHFNSICIRSKFISRYAKKYICSATLSFPTDTIFCNNQEDLAQAKSIIGNYSLEEKKQEAVQALKDGARELDPVINISQLDQLEEELLIYIEAINSQSKNIWLKPIFSCELLNDEEIKETIRIFAQTALENLSEKINYAYKNSTGFIKTDNLDLKFTSAELISMICEELDLYDPQGYIKIKAAGGIRDKETAEEIKIAANGRLSHIGTSNGLLLV